jgi:rhodanese-related sulfurtransferase
MADAPRITVEELKKRMDAGEDFTLIDVRNPQAWAESDNMLPEAIRIPLNKLGENFLRIPKREIPSMHMTLAAGYRLGPHEIPALIGEGGMGVVFQA